MTEISKGYSHRKTLEKKINDPKDKITTAKFAAVKTVLGTIYELIK